ncbi:hydrogenobyrinic acid a,c-diamide synthase (glutamine-hydrolysing) /cobyrinate a,c-diamide synthase [Pseudonocardia autotrophica]|uniref:Hydrogenobyrinate a,c-diamide synthase n=1 Tax=Pseudonocardia autotrophica TaxID=2074 RepID=A0A1Y2MRN6_PSEAH|nr:Cobyrinic acid A,C-diamide synthase [Pseudonocardia autotrophica]TDN72454.1 hydrogenobyrinic acid a,c-diamide synthase (glutamine-hydrolysing) /cobyrinate a,c-diamide synthase [Pseudonocardia autotrophica]
MNARALVVAAPSSGSGKTTVSTGLMAALRSRGTRVAPFKVGPDYIDPGYHSLAAGRPGRNLDVVLQGAERLAPLARHGSRDADIAVVEGVMGLFDGRIPDGAGSTAQVAAALGAPVLLVVDVRGQSRSLAALLHGFRSFDPAVEVAGVILNRVGSARHEEVLRASADEIGLPVLGAVPRRAELAVPSRHLGLITAAEHGAAATAAVDAMAGLVAEHVDLDAVLALARPLPDGPVWDPHAEIAAVTGAAPAPARPVSGGLARDLHAEIAAATGAAPVPARPVSGGPIRDLHAGIAATGAVPAPARPVVALAGGPAFGFGYAEHAELLEAAGAQVAVVDPLRDPDLPEGTSALVLPGGFPEEHVGALGENRSLRMAVARLAASGAPVHAECGGLLYLCRDLDGAPMCGVLEASAAMTDRLTLGYREAVAVSASPLFPAGARVGAHEFHRCAVTPRAGSAPAWAWRGAEPEGYVVAGVHASFLHTHPAGNPDSVARLVAGA